MDSLMALELRNQIERLFNIRLLLSYLLDGGSIHTVVQFITEMLNKQIVNPPLVPDPIPLVTEVPPANPILEHTQPQGDPSPKRRRLKL